MTEVVSRLVFLLARSRAVELDVISGQFGALIPRDNLKKRLSDLEELEQATKASEDIIDQRARAKLVEFFGSETETIRESYMLSNNCSDALIGRMAANKWVERNIAADLVTITELGRAEIQRRRSQSKGETN